MCAKSLQLYPNFFSPMDCSLPGSSVPGILQMRILEWVATSFSRASSQSWDETCLLCLLHWQEGSLSEPGFTRATWEAHLRHKKKKKSDKKLELNWFWKMNSYWLNSFQSKDKVNLQPGSINFLISNQSVRIDRASHPHNWFILKGPF